MSDKEKEDIYAEYESVLKGRARHEREDSITLTIVKDRISHLDRCKALPDSHEIVLGERHLEAEGFGSKARLKGVYEQSMTGAGGHGIHLASVTKNWPVFQHLLPEIAFAGHSNSGKSTLINALIGVQPRLGPAHISDRAGWTDSISFYQLGKRPPIMTVVDFPGYGHAVASKAEKTLWKDMIDQYLRERMVLTRCCVLVDSTRGICQADAKFVKTLNRFGINWSIIATKCDLLTPNMLQRSLQVMRSDLEPLFVNSNMIVVKSKVAEERQSLVIPVCAATGAGIQNLFKETVKWVDESATPITGPASVREHKLAAQLRRQIARRSNAGPSVVKVSRTLLRGLK